MSMKKQHFECLHCEFKCKDVHQLSKHYYIEHKATYVCQWCPAQFKSNPRLGQHVRLHAQRSFYPCTWCDQVVTSMDDALQHRMDVHKDKEPRYECRQCNKKLVTSCLWQVHEAYAHRSAILLGKGISSSKNRSRQKCNRKLTVSNDEKPTSTKRKKSSIRTRTSEATSNNGLLSSNAKSPNTARRNQGQKRQKLSAGIEDNFLATNPEERRIHSTNNINLVSKPTVHIEKASAEYVNQAINNLIVSGEGYSLASILSNQAAVLPGTNCRITVEFLNSVPSDPLPGKRINPPLFDSGPSASCKNVPMDPFNNCGVNEQSLSHNDGTALPPKNSITSCHSTINMSSMEKLSVVTKEKSRTRSKGAIGRFNPNKERESSLDKLPKPKNKGLNSIKNADQVEFSCGQCHLTFNNRSEHCMHNISEHELIMLCSFCEAQCLNPEALQHHLKHSHIRGKTWTCIYCWLIFDDETLLRAHYTAAGHTLFVCTICKALAPSEESLELHMKYEEAFTSNRCIKKREPNRVLESNELNAAPMHADHTNGLLCLACFKRISPHSFSQHAEEHWSKAEPLACHECFIFINDGADLNKHLDCLTAESSRSSYVSCQSCTIKCKNGKNFSRHHGWSHRSLKCHFCHYSFIGLAAKNAHENTCRVTKAERLASVSEDGDNLETEETQKRDVANYDSVNVLNDGNGKILLDSKLLKSKNIPGPKHHIFSSDSESSDDSADNDLIIAAHSAVSDQDNLKSNSASTDLNLTQSNHKSIDNAEKLEFDRLRMDRRKGLLPTPDLAVAQSENQYRINYESKSSPHKSDESLTSTELFGPFSTSQPQISRKLSKVKGLGGATVDQSDFLAESKEAAHVKTSTADVAENVQTNASSSNYTDKPDEVDSKAIRIASLNEFSQATCIPGIPSNESCTLAAKVSNKAIKSEFSASKSELASSAKSPIETVSQLESTANNVTQVTVLRERNTCGRAVSKSGYVNQTIISCSDGTVLASWVPKPKRQNIKFEENTEFAAQRNEIKPEIDDSCTKANERSDTPVGSSNAVHLMTKRIKRDPADCISPLEFDASVNSRLQKDEQLERLAASTFNKSDSLVTTRCPILLTALEPCDNGIIPDLSADGTVESSSLSDVPLDVSDRAASTPARMLSNTSPENHSVTRNKRVTSMQYFCLMCRFDSVNKKTIERHLMSVHNVVDHALKRGYAIRPSSDAVDLIDDSSIDSVHPSIHDHHSSHSLRPLQLHNSNVANEIKIEETNEIEGNSNRAKEKYCLIVRDQTVQTSSDYYCSVCKRYDEKIAILQLIRTQLMKQKE